MFLRKYEERDCEELASLFYETVHYVNCKDYSQEQLAVWATGKVDLEKWNVSFLEHDTLVAIEDNLLVGFGDMDASGYLDRLYVHKDYQSRGIASRIVEQLEANSLSPVFTTHASITARPFFEKRGYVVIREQSVERSGVMLTNYVMEKKRKLTPILKEGNIELRLFKEEDLDRYYTSFFAKEDNEINRLTATDKKFTKEEIAAYLKRIVVDKTRYDFLIQQNGKWLGEIVLHEIAGKKAGFRIALFQSQYCGKGVGSAAMRLLFDFAFDVLHIEQIELDVIVENSRAKYVYEKFGFQVSKLLSDEYCYQGESLDAYLMVLEKDAYYRARGRDRNGNC